MEKPIRRRVYVSGMVQGVSFRAYTRLMAREHGATGWVRNLSDGRVEAVIEGQRDVVEWVVSSIRKGSPFSQVSKVTVHEEAFTGEFSDFDISYGHRDYWL